MIRAIIFDCFGVLASDGWLPFRERYFSDNQDLLEKAIALNKSVDAGKSKYKDFVKEVAKMAMVSEELARTDIKNNIPNEELFSYIKSDLKSKYKIGMLSNAGENWLDDIFKPEQVDLFDATALSYEIGSIKPNLITYLTIAKRLNVEPHECIFIDDQPKYCKGAEKAGMNVINYIDFAQMRYQLDRLLT